MPSGLADRPEVAPSALGRLGRVATDLAIVALSVPLGLDLLAPPVRGGCATTLDNLAMLAGFWFLAARLAWPPLKALNDALERWIDRKRSRPPTPLADP